MSRNLPGPGDSSTWSPYSGHPNDPRAPLYDENEPDLDNFTEEEEEDVA